MRNLLNYQGANLHLRAINFEKNYYKCKQKMSLTKNENEHPTIIEDDGNGQEEFYSTQAPTSGEATQSVGNSTGTNPSAFQLHKLYFPLPQLLLMPGTKKHRFIQKTQK